MGKERTGFWLMPGTHCWRPKWRAAATSILSARCCCWCLSPRWDGAGARLQPWHLGWRCSEILPIVLLPLYWKRVRMRDAALAASSSDSCTYLFSTTGEFLSARSALTCRVSALMIRFCGMLERVAAPQLVAGLAVLVGFLTAIWLDSKVATLLFGRICLADGSIASLCTGRLSLVPSLAAAVPAVTSTLPIIIWTVSIIPTYYVWHLRTLGRPWIASGLDYAAGIRIGGIGRGNRLGSGGSTRALVLCSEKWSAQSDCVSGSL